MYSRNTVKHVQPLWGKTKQLRKYWSEKCIGHFTLRNIGREAVSDWDRVPCLVDDFSTSKVPDFHPGKISNVTHLQLAATLINSGFGFSPFGICQNSTSCNHHCAWWKAWGHHPWCEVWGEAQAAGTSEGLAQTAYTFLLGCFLQLSTSCLLLRDSNISTYGS